MAESSTSKKIFAVSWDEIQRDCRALAWRLQEHGPFTGLVVVTRGGLVPAAIVSRVLNIRYIDTVCLESYAADRAQSGVETIKGIEHDGESLLILDDLVDTGETAKVIRAMLPKAHFATVYAKPKGKPLVDSFVTEVSQDTWIHFPWEEDTKFW